MLNVILPKTRDEQKEEAKKKIKIEQKLEEDHREFGGIKTETEYGKYKVCFHRGMWEHTFLLNCYGRQLYDIMKSNHIKSNDTGGFLCPERI